MSSEHITGRHIKNDPRFNLKGFRTLQWLQKSPSSQVKTPRCFGRSICFRLQVERRKGKTYSDSCNPWTRQTPNIHDVREKCFTFSIFFNFFKKCVSLKPRTLKLRMSGVTVYNFPCYHLRENCVLLRCQRPTKVAKLTDLIPLTFLSFLVNSCTLSASVITIFYHS